MGRRIGARSIPARQPFGLQSVEVICAFETDLRYLRVAMGASASPVVICAELWSIQEPPSLKVSVRLNLHL